MKRHEICILRVSKELQHNKHRDVDKNHQQVHRSLGAAAIICKTSEHERYPLTKQSLTTAIKVPLDELAFLLEDKYTEVGIALLRIYKNTVDKSDISPERRLLCGLKKTDTGILLDIGKALGKRIQVGAVGIWKLQALLQKSVYLVFVWCRNQVDLYFFHNKNLAYQRSDLLGDEIHDLSNKHYMYIIVLGIYALGDLRRHVLLEHGLGKKFAADKGELSLLIHHVFS